VHELEVEEIFRLERSACLHWRSPFLALLSARAEARELLAEIGIIGLKAQGARLDLRGLRCVPHPEMNLGESVEYTGVLRLELDRSLGRLQRLGQEHAVLRARPGEAVQV